MVELKKPLPEIPRDEPESARKRKREEETRSYISSGLNRVEDAGENNECQSQGTTDRSGKSAEKRRRKDLKLAERQIAKNGESVSSEGRISKPGRKSKEDDNGSNTGDHKEESDKVRKHKKLMEKRQKSQSKADPTQAQIESSDEELLEEPEEAEEVYDLVPLPQPEPVPQPASVPSSAALPSWMANPIRIPPSLRADFEGLGLQKQACGSLQEAGYSEAFAIQAAVLPLLLPSFETGDVLVSAATGSGKTLAYVLPMVHNISQFASTELRGVIVMPTRELVAQAKHVADVCSLALSARKQARIGTAVGSEAFKMEQSKIMQETSHYNPQEYESQPSRENRKWDNETEGDDDAGFGNLFDTDHTSTLPNHVVGFRSKVDILICTPGRLVEHMKLTPGFTIKHISWLIIDEADKLLDQSFQQWVEVILAGIGFRAPRREVRKVILSATMTKDIGQLSQLRLHRPRFVELESTNSLDTSTDFAQGMALPLNLYESGVKIEDDRLKPLYLVELLRQQNLLFSDVTDDSSESDSSESSSDEESDDESSASPASSSTISNVEEKSMPTERRGVLIFTRSNETAIRLSRLLALLSPASASRMGTLTSTLPRKSRERTIQSFSTGAIFVLVASDLVSRGLDLPNLAHVINYDVPSSLNTYVHRVGRTARAGKTGHAWTLFGQTDARWFWNEVARTTTLKRERKVERLNIHKEKFGEDEIRRYENALEELGNEAATSSR